MDIWNGYNLEDSEKILGNGGRKSKFCPKIPQNRSQKVNKEPQNVTQTVEMNEKLTQTVEIESIDENETLIIDKNVTQTADIRVEKVVVNVTQTAKESVTQTVDRNVTQTEIETITSKTPSPPGQLCPGRGGGEGSYWN